MSKSVNPEMKLVKALARSGENSFEMENVTDAIERTQVQPKLLTALFGGEINNIPLDTNTVKYDDIEDTAQLPNGKRFDEFGKRLGKDKPRELIYSVGSFGVTGNVAPSDVVNRRKMGTSELLTEDELVSRMLRKADVSWGLFNELAFAQLLTTDSNITLGGPMSTYDYFDDVTGATRIATFGGDGKISMQLGADVDHWQLFQEQTELLETDVEKTMNSSSMTVAICGKSFFNQRLEIEKQAGLARDLKLELDMQSMGVPTSSFGSGRFNYQWFDSFDGIRYIRYSANILGAKLIADEDAYLVPIGAEKFMKMAYAPAQTREYVNTSALTRYAEMETHNRRGVTVSTESNVLPLSVNPQLIRQLKV
jgi:hypothetical protein